MDLRRLVKESEISSGIVDAEEEDIGSFVSDIAEVLMELSAKSMPNTPSGDVQAPEKSGQANHYLELSQAKKANIGLTVTVGREEFVN